ncbi:hypothetical protein PUN28_013316 [Cardiocondyla obscurior]|uniref:Uncharacterized protein n=1 Tax=Cardiocondyla obscurior TaxID=286306 RepID=A0AAW2FAW1_9HYME
MIDGIEDLRDFVTIYKKDFFEKKPTGYKSLPRYLSSSNILNRSYKRYLNTQLENRSLPEKERSEDPQDYLNEIRDKFPYLRNALPEVVPDQNVIEREKKKSTKTMYQLHYSKELERGYLKEIALPQNWIIHETIQKRAYRNPWEIATRELIRPAKIFKPRNNLAPNPREREILGVTTGHSEYTGTIGITGERIKLQSPPDIKVYKY